MAVSQTHTDFIFSYIITDRQARKVLPKENIWGKESDLFAFDYRTGGNRAYLYMIALTAWN